MLCGRCDQREGAPSGRLEKQDEGGHFNDDDEFDKRHLGSCGHAEATVHSGAILKVSQ